MRSLIIIEVEHGETTDGLGLIAENAIADNKFVRTYYSKVPEILDYSVVVDIPPYLTANNINSIIERA